MPLKRYAQEVSPYGLVKEIEGRVALKIPEKVIKEVNLYESYDQQSARYTLVWWNEEQTAEYNPEKVLKEIIDQVTRDRKDIEVDVTRVKKSYDTSQIMVTLSRTSPKKEAAASGPVKNVVLPLTITVGSNFFNIESPDMGSNFSISRNEVVLASGLPNVAAALGALLRFVLIDLLELEELTFGKVNENAVDKEFLIGVMQWFANSPVVTKDAYKNLKSFMELVTKREFEPGDG